MTDPNNQQRVVGGGVEMTHERLVRDRDASLSEAVIEAVAEATGDDPASMQQLYDVVDPDALDKLFEATTPGARESSLGRVSFRFNGCWVTAHADGRIVVSECDE